MATSVSNGKKARKTTPKTVGTELVSFTQTLAPDIYKRVEKYCEENGFKPQDVVRQATAHFLIRAGY